MEERLVPYILAVVWELVSVTHSNACWQYDSHTKGSAVLSDPPLSCRYLVTFSPLMDTQDDPQAIIIWDILTGHKKRGFHCESSAHWPIFKWVDFSPGLPVAFPCSLVQPDTAFLHRWSHDGKFFARMTLDTLSIYETPVSFVLFSNFSGHWTRILHARQLHYYCRAIS